MAMKSFPRTEVAGVSLPRMLMGTNWVYGWSHTGAAADRNIVRMNSNREAIQQMLEAYLAYDINALMGPISDKPFTYDAIRAAEDKTGKGIILIDTPILNVDDTPEGRREAERVLDKVQKGGATFCLIHHSSAEQLVNRMISSEALVDSYSLRKGSLSEEDWDSLAIAASRLSSCNILIDDTSGITVTGMKAKLRRVPDLGMVVIDYLQLMQSDRRVDNRVQEVAEISRAMKIMAKDLMVPVICCAQLSRGPESRTDKKPMLSDLRDSGAIEQDADVVMFLYRDEYYKTNESSDPNSAPASSIAEVIIAKNRHGSTGTVQMGWIGKYTKFRTIEDADSAK